MNARGSMLFSFVDGVFVGVHTKDAPSAQDWRKHCLEIERRRNETRGVLVFTLGGGPSSKQREQMRDALHELKPPPTAILTGSGLVRGIVTALNWFFGGQQIAAFEPDRLHDALHYLEKNGASASQAQIQATLSQLAATLGVELPEARPLSLRAQRRQSKGPRPSRHTHT